MLLFGQDQSDTNDDLETYLWIYHECLDIETYEILARIIGKEQFRVELYKLLFGWLRGLDTTTLLRVAREEVMPEDICGESPVILAALKRLRSIQPEVLQKAISKVFNMPAIDIMNS